MLYAKGSGSATRRAEFVVGERNQAEGTAPLTKLWRTWAFSSAGDDPEPASGVIGKPTDCWVTDAVLKQLNEALPDESSEVRKLSSWPVVRTFVYLDVSGFARYKPGQEALIINSLVEILSTDWYWTGPAATLHERCEALMCIGDGYIFVFQEPMPGTYFAAYLAQLIEVLVARRRLPVQFHFRMGVHVGEIYHFWDPGRNDWNYIGDGINGGNRVLSAIDKGYDDQVFISGEVRQALMANPGQDACTPTLLANLHNRGRREDKHGRPWRVYEVAHTALCADELPPELRQ
jgi:class 3 adenylate cyclase